MRGKWVKVFNKNIPDPRDSEAFKRLDDEEFKKGILEAYESAKNQFEYECSECGAKGCEWNIETPYCAWCGAEMEIEVNEND